MASYIDELINSNTSDLSSKVTSLKSTDISSINIGSSVSSDKVFESVSKSETTSNVFGVFDSKQVVQELSADTNSAFSTELIDDLDPEKLKNMSTKVGSEITTDVDFNSAVSDIMGSVSTIKQKALTAAEDMYGSTVTVITSTGAEVKATLLENVTIDDSMRDLIPSNMSVSDFGSLKNLFNSANGVGNFNSCDALAALLGLASSLIDANALFNALKNLFGLLSKYDLAGILKCIAQVTGSLDNLQTAELSNMLIKSGSVNSYSEFTSIGNNGSVLNSYSTVRRIGTNSTLSSSNRSSFDTLFSNLGTSKESVFDQNSYNDTQNSSILDSIDSPVYDRTSIIEATDSGFSDYCFSGNGTDNLISSIPDTLFS